MFYITDIWSLHRNSIRLSRTTHLWGVHMRDTARPPGYLLSRRQALGAGLALGGAALLAACSSSDKTTPQSTALQKDTGKVTILTWETYQDKPWLDAYKSQSGVQVDAITVGSGDEMFAKAQSGTV